MNLFGKKLVLKIECTSFCNQHCIFCPQDHYRLKNQTMSLDFYKKIIDVLKSSGVRLSLIHFGGMGEPLLDKLLFERIEYSKKITNKFTLTTNGRLLKGDILDKVNGCFNKVFFSFHGNTPMEYEKFTGNNFEEMKQTYLTAKAKLGSRLILSNHPEGKLHKVLDGSLPTTSDIHPFHNYVEPWLTEKTKAYGIDASMMGQKYCEFNLFIIVAVDGSISTCCNDWNNENNILQRTYPKCQRCNNQVHFQKLIQSKEGVNFERLLSKLTNEIGELKNVF